DIDDLVQALLEGLSPLRIEVGCGQTIDNILSVVLDAVGGLTLSIEDLVALIDLDLTPLGLDPDQLAALLALDVVLFDGGTLADLDSALSTGITVDDCILVVLCVNLEINGDIDVTATITEPGGDPTFDDE